MTNDYNYGPLEHELTGGTFAEGDDEHEQPTPEGERVTVELIDGEAGRCIGINEYRVCGPKPIHGVVVTSWKTTRNDILRAFLTPDEKHDWLAKDLTVVPAEHARLAALMPGLEAVLREELSALYVWQNAIHPKSDIQEGITISIDKVQRALNAVAKERNLTDKGETE